MKKGLQLFDKKKNARFRDLSPTQIVRFLEDFRKLSLEEVKESRAISLRIDTLLLRAFREKCKKEGLTSYQKQIRLLMAKWLAEDS